jgi:hypothetical protein
MTDPSWEFRRMTRGEINVDPIEGEFFSTEVLGSLPDALVREAIQNSLDAGIPGEQVKVLISFPSSDNYLQTPSSEPYLRGLEIHLDSENSGLQERVELTDPMDFILIEDFGTRGLEGDIREDEDRGAQESKNDFFYFWRNIGRAVEGTTARGRWGLGKTVFQAASRVNSFFGLTIRRDESEKLLMGQSVLRIHWSQGTKYAPYGYYGQFDGDFALPVEDRARTEEFCRDFSIRRRNEPGLSVVIPFPDKEIKPEAILRAVIHQYFFPLLAEDLVVIVASGRNQQVLDARSIFQYVSLSDWSEKDTVLRRLELAKWSLGLSPDQFEKLQEPAPNRAPKWEESLFERAQLKRLREDFDNGARLALVAPLWVKRANKDIQHSSFKIILERDPYLDPGEDHFLRDGVAITGISSLRQKGIRVIVTVSDRPLSRMLGDSENPAHTEWQERSPKFRGRYDWGTTCLRYVKNSPREIARVLSRPAEGRDPRVLRDFFYVDLPKEDQPGNTEGRPAPKRGLEPGQRFPLEITGDRTFQVHKTKQGFRLTADPIAKVLPREISIEMAYDVREGNPFKRYRILDFELDKPPIKVKAAGLRIQHPRANVLYLVLEKRDFHLSLTGFDPNRDLKIRMTTSFDVSHDPQV